MNCKKVALIAPFPWVGVSNPILNSIQWFLSNGWAVDLYTDINATQAVESWPPVCFQGKFRNLVFRHSRYKTFLQLLLVFIKPYHEYRFYRDHLFALWYGFLSKRYDLIIAYDEHGLERASLVNRHWKTKLIYHSLEFYEHEGILKARERINSNNATLVLTQDPKRASLLSKLNHIHTDKIRILYNSTIERPRPDGVDYFRYLFDIPASVKIVLVTGSLTPQHGIFHLLDAISSLPPNWVLVIHGWASPEVVEILDQTVINFPGKVFHSSILLDFNDKHLVFRSVDVGCVVFAGDDSNYLYGAGSAGKLYDFMQAGVPILGNNIPGMFNLLDLQGCGVTVPLDNFFFSSLAVIESNIDNYRASSFKAFKQYDFSQNLSNIVNSFLGFSP